MIETAFLLFGLGFSFLVYFRSIRTADISFSKKAFYGVLTTIGITGMLFLFGVLISDFLHHGSFLDPVILPRLP